MPKKKEKAKAELWSDKKLWQTALAKEEAGEIEELVFTSTAIEKIYLCRKPRFIVVVYKGSGAKYGTNLTANVSNEFYDDLIKVINTPGASVNGYLASTIGKKTNMAAVHYRVLNV